MKGLRVVILGGGPAGLYTAILLKRANPAHAVTVLERNPAGATFGFGVVLSDRTLTNFQQADPVTFDAITAHQAAWEAIETIHRGQRIRCEGHYYQGIGRKRLLDILQQRCEALGVTLRFTTEAGAPESFRDYDLVVAADGVNSGTRNALSEQFGATATRSKSKYIWLGAEYTPTAFTFVFVETEHGLFQAHIYPYDERMSTCIVQCRDETWQRAGLDRLSEAESVRFCEELLSPYTVGARFVSNRSLWSTFAWVRTENWRHENIVLLGDAAHTAHWSIGSGTKLAMEDAIALVGALQRNTSIPRALAEYQAERKPIVQKLQLAGRISELYCENVEFAMHLDPLPFAFGLMTRSRRLDYDSLHQRDPAFIAQVNRYYGDAAVPPALTPYRLGGLHLPNRLLDLHRIEPQEPIRTRRGQALAVELRPADDDALTDGAHRAAAAGADILLLPLSDNVTFRETWSAVRAVWPEERPLGAVIPLESDSALPSVLEKARYLAAAGCSLLRLALAPDPTLAPVAEQIRNVCRIPVLASPVSSLAQANTLVAGGRADLCHMTHPS